MTGSTPPRKRRFLGAEADQGPFIGPQRARDDERGSSGAGPSGGGAPLDAAEARDAEILRDPGAGPDPAADRDVRDGLPAVARPAGPAARRRTARVARMAEIRDLAWDRTRERALEGVRRGGDRARAGLSSLADRIIDLAPRVPVRDLATLRAQFPGLGPEQLADKLVAGAAAATSAVGAGVGAAAMLPVPPAMPTEIAVEITGVAAIELKLIAELHEVYGLRPPGGVRERSVAYLSSWSGERGIQVLRPSTVNSAVSSRMKRELRQQIMKRTVRDLPNLMPFMVGAAVGAAMNHRDTRRVAERIRKDLRHARIPWDVLPELPPLESPDDPLPMDEITGGPGTGGNG
ncbi:hypothetical protein [Streptomyces sp. NPDC047000]|uniref:hypothetical protein n=1 Tax=Streptomyces sp. NPDC047000 TaxID=3155474 RepID=UPI0033E367CD